MSLAPVKVKKPYAGIVYGVSKNGVQYQSKSTKYGIDSARINNRKGAPLGYLGAWKLKTLKP